MIGVAWVTGVEKDCFSNSSISSNWTVQLVPTENRLLLIATGCDCDGKIFMILHSYFPNQRM